MAIGFRFRNGLGTLPPISDVMYYNIRNMSYNDDRLDLRPPMRRIRHYVRHITMIWSV